MLVFSATSYTANVQGQTVKRVPCEECKSEYVYVLEREGMGTSTNFGVNWIPLSDPDAAVANAKSGADEILDQYLANDFDPIPCPVCGHYQKFMFSKLIGSRHFALGLLSLASLMIGIMSFIGIAYWLITYVQTKTERAGQNLLFSAIAFLVTVTVYIYLSVTERRRVSRFDPNLVEDQQLRIAIGKSRSMTLAEFETKQIEKGPPDQQ